MFAEEICRLSIYVIDVLVRAIRADDRFEWPVDYPLGGVQVRGSLWQQLLLKLGVLSDELPYVLRLVAWGVIDE